MSGILKIRLHDAVRAKLGTVCQVRGCTIEELVADELARAADDLTTRAPLTSQQSVIAGGDANGTTINNYNILTNLKVLSENVFAPVLSIAANISWKLFPDSIPRDVGSAMAIGFVVGVASTLLRFFLS